MIIGNNYNNNFNNKDFEKRQNIMNKNFENKWNEVKEQGQTFHEKRNVFVKDLQSQKYTSASNTEDMHDKTLAMLSDRLEKGTLTMEEFNKKCAELSKKGSSNQ